MKFTISRSFHTRNGQRGKKMLRHGEDIKANSGRVPRVARLMALAIKFDQLIEEGVVSDQAELARLGLVSRARLTQILNLLNIAPDIQEEILYMSKAQSGRQTLTERSLRPIAAELDWSRQKRMWHSMYRIGQSIRRK